MNGKQWIALGIIAAFSGIARAHIDTQPSPFYVEPLPQPYATQSEPDIAQDIPSDESAVLDLPDEYTHRSYKRKSGGKSGKMVADFFKTVLSDIFYLNVNLFTWNTFKIIAGTFPAYIAARMIDDKLHSCFYDKSGHKNINQLPDWCQTVARVSIAVPIVLLGMDAFLSRDDDRRWTAQILLLGIPFVIWAKKIVKLSKFDGCQRPWNEHFDCENRSFGGFPSGHMAQALYMTVLYGVRYGPRLAIPLSMIATVIGVSFVTCNRHYLSQIVAGGAFGAIYALAASKLVDMKLADKVKLRIKIDAEGKPTFSAGVSW